MANIKLFQDKKIRSVWNDEEEQWYFSVVDVVAALTDSINPTDYLKKMRKRDEALGSFIGTNCPQVDMIKSQKEAATWLAWHEKKRRENLAAAFPTPTIFYRPKPIWN